MTVRVRFTALAEDQIATIDSWWRQEREASSTLFSEELAEALGFLSPTTRWSGRDNTRLERVQGVDRAQR